MTTHIMVDLETWGTAPGCDIRSIGAVVFDPLAGTLGDEFYVNVDNPAGRMRNGIFVRELATGAEDYRKYPLNRDPSTIEWWSQQSEAAQAALTCDVVDLDWGLRDFADWLHRQMPVPCEHPLLRPIEDMTFWAHGPHFDEAILAACYRATGIPVPWHYRAPRDCRTIFEAAGDQCYVAFEGVEHDALADAKNQALRVIEAYRRIRGDRVTELLRYNNEQVERRRAIATAARNLYLAARWSSAGALPEIREAELWVGLRDALELPKGSATAAGVGASPSEWSDLDRAHHWLKVAAEHFEDASAYNETMMDACVEDARSNELATDLRKRAQAIKKLADEAMG